LASWRAAVPPDFRVPGVFTRSELTKGRVDEKTLEIGSSDVSVVWLLLNGDRTERQRSTEPVEIGAMTRYDRPMPTTNNYDQLLKKWPDQEVIQ